MRKRITRISGALAAAALCTAMPCTAFAQTVAPTTEKSPVYLPTPSFDTASINSAADPCQDFYQFACGKYAANHPIPADQSSVDAFATLYNVNTQQLRSILSKEETATGRTSSEQKIGDDYHACMDTASIEQRGLAPLEPLLRQIDSTGLFGLATTIGQLQRLGINVFFSFGEQQDFKDASKQIAYIDQGGLGLPEKDFYLRTGVKDEQIRRDYVAYMTKMLTFAGASPQQALKQANDIMRFETALAKASMGVTERRDPLNTYHLVPVADVSRNFPMSLFSQFESAIHSPRVSEINDANPGFIPAMVALLRSTDVDTLRAYMRVHTLTAFATQLPRRFDQTRFDFYSKELYGQQEQRARWQRCSATVDDSLGEALGEVYVKQYFAGDSKRKMLEMVSDIEQAMGRDIDSLDWMSPETKVRAHEKLHGIANKIGYPDHFRDYSAVTIKPDDPIGNQQRATAFENDRQLGKIGKPVDHGEWGMTPPTVNAYYNPSMNDINFPAGILQPNFYDAKGDDAVNYGHIGGVIGHELTHGFDDQGKKFDAKGNLSDWWTPEDTKKFESKTDCLVNEYGQFIAVDDVHVNGKLTLGENTADNGGLLLAYMAYLERAKKEGVNLDAKVQGYTAPQRFYISWAQNWCSNDRPEMLRSLALTNEHSPDRFRANGPLVNQPGFAGAFSCKAGTPMVPVKSCRVW